MTNDKQEASASADTARVPRPLTAEEKEKFLNNWLEDMPEVANWSDNEILSGILSGM